MEIDAKEIKNALTDWLLDIDDHEILPDGISALNFGLYQGGFDGQIGFKQALAEHPYEIELTGSIKYDADDDNWVCDEGFIPVLRSCPRFSIPEIFDRDIIFDAVAQALMEISNGLNISILDVPYITMGFTDENLSIIRSDDNRTRQQKNITDTDSGNYLIKEYEYPIECDTPEDEQLKAFISKNISFYKVKWNKHENGYLKGWNWASFFFPAEWLVYRKMYVEASLVLFVTLVFNIIIPIRITGIIVAIMGNAFYYKKYLRVLNRTDDMTQNGRIEYLKAKGGVSVISVVVCIVFELVISVATWSF